MIRTLTGTFRATAAAVPPPPGPPNGLNLYDTLSFGAGAPGWTGGATIVEQVAFQPLPSERWVVYGFSVSAKMRLQPASNAIAVNTYIPYGKFGKLFAALLFGTDYVSATGSPADPTVHPMLGEPSDMSTSVDLWNPAVDDIPPLFTSSQRMPVSCTLNLVQPRELQLAQQLGIGIWMTPSLLNNTPSFPCLYVVEAKYAVVYDDGHR